MPLYRVAVQCKRIGAGAARMSLADDYMIIDTYNWDLL